MLGGISIWQLLILLAIVVMVFGTKRLRNLGGDLGGALRDFRSAMKQGEHDEDQDADKTQGETEQHRVIDQEPGEQAPGKQARGADETASHDRTP